MKTGKLIALFIFATATSLYVTACFKSERQAQSASTQKRTYSEQGTTGGVPFSKDGTETVIVEATSQSTTRAGLDEAAVAALVSKSVNAAIGPYMAALPKPGLSATEVGTGGAAVLTTILAVLKALEARGHKRENDELWDEIKEKAKKATT